MRLLLALLAAALAGSLQTDAPPSAEGPALRGAGPPAPGPALPASTAGAGAAAPAPPQPAPPEPPLPPLPDGTLPVFTCPLLHAIWDAPQRLDAAIAAASPYVARCRLLRSLGEAEPAEAEEGEAAPADGAASSSSGASRCARAEADLSAYLRQRTALLFRRAAFSTRRGPGLTARLATAPLAQWGGLAPNAFPQWWLNYSVRGQPALLLDVAPLLAEAAAPAAAGAEGAPPLPPAAVLLQLPVGFVGALREAGCGSPGGAAPPAVGALFASLPGCPLAPWAGNSSALAEGPAARPLAWMASRLRTPAPIASSLFPRLSALQQQQQQQQQLSGHGHAHSASSRAEAAAAAQAAYPRVHLAHASPLRQAPAALHTMLMPLGLGPSSSGVRIRLYEGGTASGSGAGEASLLYPRFNGSFPLALQPFELEHFLEGVRPGGREASALSAMFSAAVVHPGSVARDGTAWSKEEVGEGAPHLHLLPRTDAPRALVQALQQRAQALAAAAAAAAAPAAAPPGTEEAACPLAFPTAVLADKWEADILPGNAVFIPSGWAFTWHALPAAPPSASSEARDGAAAEEAVVEAEAVVLEWSWADASNLVAVREWLESSSAVHTDPQAAGLLDLLEDPALDTRVARVPPSPYSAWPLRQAGGSAAAAGAALPDAAAAAAAEEASAPLATPTPLPILQLEGESTAQWRRRQRKALEGGSAAAAAAAAAASSSGDPPIPAPAAPPATGGSSRLKLWQEEGKWTALLKALTLPAPSAPIPIAVGRSNVTLMWRAAAAAAAGHITGYRVSWHGEGAAMASDAAAARSAVDSFIALGEVVAGAAQRRALWHARLHTLADADLLKAEHVTALPDGTPVLFVREAVAGGAAGSSSEAAPRHALRNTAADEAAAATAAAATASSSTLRVAALGSLDFGLAISQANAERLAALSQLQPNGAPTAAAAAAAAAATAATASPAPPSAGPTPTPTTPTAMLPPGYLASVAPMMDHSDLLAYAAAHGGAYPPGTGGSSAASGADQAAAAAAAAGDDCVTSGGVVLNRTRLLASIRGLNPTAASRLRAYEVRLDAEVAEAAGRLQRAAHALAAAVGEGGGSEGASWGQGARGSPARRRLGFSRSLPQAALEYLGGEDVLLGVEAAAAAARQRRAAAAEAAAAAAAAGAAPPPSLGLSPAAAAAAAAALGASAPRTPLARHTALGLSLSTSSSPAFAQGTSNLHPSPRLPMAHSVHSTLHQGGLSHRGSRVLYNVSGSRGSSSSSSGSRRGSKASPAQQQSAAAPAATRGIPSASLPLAASISSRRALGGEHSSTSSSSASGASGSSSTSSSSGGARADSGAGGAPALPFFPTPTAGCGAGGAEDTMCLTVTGLAPGHAYSFRMASVSSDGSTSSDSGASSPILTAPLTPPGPFVAAPGIEAVDLTSITLSWPPLPASVPDTGGLPLLGLLITRQDVAIGGLPPSNATGGSSGSGSSSSASSGAAAARRRSLQAGSSSSSSADGGDAGELWGHHMVVPASLPPSLSVQRDLNSGRKFPSMPLPPHTAAGTGSSSSSSGSGSSASSPPFTPEGSISSASLYSGGPGWNATLGATILGLLPGSTFRFRVAAVTALGVGAPSPPSLPVTTLTLKEAGGVADTGGRVVAIVGNHGRLAHMAAPVNATHAHGLTALDTSGTLSSEGEADVLALLAQLHASVAVVHAGLVGGGETCVPAADLLERSGLGSGAWDMFGSSRLAGALAPPTLLTDAGSSSSSGGRVLLASDGTTHGPRSPPLTTTTGSSASSGGGGAGLGHALGLWMGTRAVVYPQRARGGRTLEVVETEPSPLLTSEHHALLPGVGGPALYSALYKERLKASAREEKAGAGAAAAAAEAGAGGGGEEGAGAGEAGSVAVGVAEGVRGRGRLLVGGGDPFFAAQAAASATPPRAPAAALLADSQWTMDAAYMAMAQARVAPFVRRLGALYEASAVAAGARAGLDCVGEEEGEEGEGGEGGEGGARAGTSRLCYPSGLKASLRAREEAARLLRDAASGAPGAGHTPPAPAPAYPCISPLVTLSDMHSLLTVHSGGGGEEGSASAAWVAQAWASHASPRAYAVRAEVVAAVPLVGNLTVASPRGAQLRSAWGVNAGEWAGRIVLFERGAPSTLAEKVRGAGDAGALGVLIMDDGEQRCGSAAAPVFTQRCVQGSDKVWGHAGGGFAASDSAAAWHAAQLPTLLLTREDGLRLMKLLQA